MLGFSHSRRRPVIIQKGKLSSLAFSPPYSFPSVAIANDHNPGGWKQQNSFSPSSGDHRFQTSVSTAAVLLVWGREAGGGRGAGAGFSSLPLPASGRSWCHLGSLAGMCTDLCLHPHLAFSLCSFVNPPLMPPLHLPLPYSCKDSCHWV